MPRVASIYCHDTGQPQADLAAIERLMALGFDQVSVTLAYMTSGKDEMVAANMLMDVLSA